MTDSPPTRDERHESDALEPVASEASETVEAYDTEDGVVFYDADNPVAWLQATRAVSLEEYR
ncbi:MAG: hypothetical protein ABEJ04_03790 [Halobacteriaceae archaeon]